MSSLRLTKHHAIKTYGGVNVYLHAFLTSALDELSSQLHAPASLYPIPTGQEGVWAPEPVSMRWRREEFPAPAVDSNPDRPVRSLVRKLSELFRHPDMHCAIFYIEITVLKVGNMAPVVPLQEGSTVYAVEQIGTPDAILTAVRLTEKVNT
jgi:hypothetical protein